MRDYSKVSPKFWIGGTGKDLKKAGAEAIVVGLYLMTSPHSNMLGLFYQPELLIAHETGLGFEGAKKGLQGCIDVGFCAYDAESEMVWVYEMAAFQIGEALVNTDKRSKGVQNEYNALPENPFLGSFFDKYESAFHLTTRRGVRERNLGTLEGASDPLRSQEQEQEQEQEQKQEQEQPLSTSQSTRDVVDEVFDYWRKCMNSPRSALDDKRRKAIKAALAMGYTPRQLCQAIRGCSLTPHNMGQNDRGEKYNGITLILRSADQIDRFIANDTAPPRSAVQPGMSKQQSVMDESERNLAAYAAMVNGHDASAPTADDPMTIDMEM